MADATEQRDFFISFTGADLAYAEAIDAALRAAGFTTYFHPRDIEYGGNIPVWMDNALMNARQMLALYSPDYVADRAVYSKAERYAQFWQDSIGADFKLIPVELKSTTFTPLMSVYKRLGVTGKTPVEAAAAVVDVLKKPNEIKQRDLLNSPEPMPAVFNVLYGRNPNFSGRFEAMESLQKSLREGNAAITALAGMGGVGKTTLAAEYCHRFGARYGGVWWVRAEESSVMLSDLAALGARVGLVASGNIEADARSALNHVVSQPKPWLVVYDNAPTPDAVNRWRPAGAVRCLITSRHAGFDGIAKVTPLGEWSDEVTADYLVARTAREDKAGASRLAHALGGLPLAAEQAAVFLKDRKGISFDNYASDIARLIKRPKPQGSTGEYPDTVYAAFVKSLETLENTEGGNTALDILRLCSFLSPDGVDLELLKIDAAAEVLPASFAKVMFDDTAREDAFAMLVSLSLLRQEDGPSGTVLIFHRLLLEVARDWIGVDIRNLWGDAAIQLVSGVFPGGVAVNPSTWPLCARLMPHIAPLYIHVPQTHAAGKAMGRLLNQACIYLNIRGDRTGALELASRAVDFGRRANVEPLNLSAGLNNLAARLAALGRLGEAEETYKESLAIKETFLELKDPRIATTQSNLAEVYLKRKQFSQAEELLLRAAENTMTAFGEKSGEYGTRLSNLGALYGSWADEPGETQKAELAEKYSTRALDVTRAARGTRHPETRNRYGNLAIMRANRNDWRGAIAELERKIATMMSLDLSQHSDLPHDLAILSYCWRRIDEPDKAARLDGGDISDLLPVIAQIESEHRAWAAEDPDNRHFGPPSPFNFED